MFISIVDLPGTDNNTALAALSIVGRYCGLLITVRRSVINTPGAAKLIARGFENEYVKSLSSPLFSLFSAFAVDCFRHAYHSALHLVDSKRSNQLYCRRVIRSNVSYRSWLIIYFIPEKAHTCPSIIITSANIFSCLTFPVINLWPCLRRPEDFVRCSFWKDLLNNLRASWNLYEWLMKLRAKTSISIYIAHLLYTGFMCRP